MNEKNKEFLIAANAWIKRNKRVLIVWFSLVSLFMVFESRVAILLLKYNLIGPDQIIGRFFIALYYAAVILSVIFFVYFFIRNYRLSKYLNFWFLLLATECLILRTNQADKLEFIQVNTNLWGFSFFFADLLLFLGGLIIVLFIRNLFGDFEVYDQIKLRTEKFFYLGRVAKESIYKEDIPVEGSQKTDNDIIASTLMNQLKTLQPTNAFVIGINAEWGIGKTTLLNRIDYMLRHHRNENEKSYIIFWFNAWQHQDEKSIINNFFNQLKKELSNYSGDASSSINKYLGRLLALIDNKYGKSLSFISEDLLKSQSTISDYYNNINHLISSINRKIIVFVDDLDRLNKSEIVEVVRILRNVANFQNTVFICGYDKSYVIKTGGFDNNFLDKIFNLEINLPKFPQNGLLLFLEETIKASQGIQAKDKVINAVKSIFETDTDEFFDVTIDDIVDSTPAIKPELPIIPINPSLFFESRRDVKRFYNSLVTDLAILGDTDNVDLKDYTLLKLLLFKYSWMLKYFDNKVVNIWLGNSSVLNFKRKELFTIIEDELEFVDKVIIGSVLSNLFPNLPSQVSLNSSIKINQRRYFPIYLNNNVFNQSFSYAKLISAHENSKINELIQEEIKNKHKENENYLLNDIKSFILKEENLDELQRFSHSVDVIDKHLSKRIGDYEMMKFLHAGEKLNGFEALANSVIFVKIDDGFGRFLRQLNMAYVEVPKDISTNQDTIRSFLRRNKISELKVLTSAYVKNKLIDLYAQYLKSGIAFEQAGVVLLDLAETHYTFFNLYLYYNEVNELFKKYIEENFKQVFLSKTPKEFLELTQGDLIPGVFVDQVTKKTIIAEAQSLLKTRDNWKESNLDKEVFLKNGWTNFLNFYRELCAKNKLSKNETEKAERLGIFIFSYIKRKFTIPDDKEVDIDDLMRKLDERDKKRKEEGED